MVTKTTDHGAPTTSRRAKAAYKQAKGIPQLTSQDRRRIERGLLLDKRAGSLREQEKKRKDLQRRKDERDRKEKAARAQLGIGLATQMAGYSHSQKKMKSGMESFLGLGRKRAEASAGEDVQDHPSTTVFDDDAKEREDVWSQNESVDCTEMTAVPVMEPGKICDESLLEQLAIGHDDNNSAAASQTPSHRSAATMPDHMEQSCKRTYSQTVENFSEDWTDMFDSGTQLTRELNAQSPPRKRPCVEKSLVRSPPSQIDKVAAWLNTSFDTNYGSDITDLDEVEDTVATLVSGLLDNDAVQVRDFAYTEKPYYSVTADSSMAMKPPLRQNPTRLLRDSGLSTQVLFDAFDQDEDDENHGIRDGLVVSHHANVEPSDQHIHEPRLRNLAKPVFKPPASRLVPSSSLQDLGLSTQILQDATMDDISLSPIQSRI